MSDAVATLYKSVRTALNGNSIWASRLYADEAPATAQRPYVVYFVQGGGELNAVRQNDAGYILHVRVVSDNPVVAQNGRAELSRLLNNSGLQDGGAITGDSDWAILTITQETIVDIREAFANAVPIFHKGHQFRVHMEEI